MEKIVIDNVLEAIHYILQRNGFKFTDRQITLADEYIIPAISEIKIDPKQFKFKTVGAPKLVTDKRIIPAVIEYFAYLEDNTSLYNDLRDEEYIFYNNYVIKYYALDRLITGTFTNNEFRNMLLKYEGAIAHFYFSIKELSKEEKEKYAKDFSDIVHRDQTTLKVCSNDSYNFLVKKNIDLFGKDFLLKLSPKQREMINNLYIDLDEVSASKIKELITKYPDYNNSINISNDLLRYLSVDEISSISIKDSMLYKEALKVGLQDRIRSILKLDSSFNCPSSFIREEIFRVLSDSEIVGLSDLGIAEILNIKIPEINNVLVMPIRKIRKIVSHDKKRKKEEEKNNSTRSITK